MIKYRTHLEELLDEAVLARAPPDDGIVLVWQQEADGHDAQALIHKDRGPARGAGVNLLALQAQHARYAWPADVNVQQPHLCM